MRYIVENKLDHQGRPVLVLSMHGLDGGCYLPVCRDDFNRIKEGDLIEVFISCAPKERECDPNPYLGDHNPFDQLQMQENTLCICGHLERSHTNVTCINPWKIGCKECFCENFNVMPHFPLDEHP